MSYHLVYDAASVGSSFEWIMLVAGIALGITLTVILVCIARRAGGFKAWFPVVWLVMATTLGGLGFSNVVHQRSLCREWLRSGSYEVVAGPVEHFVPMPYSGHAHESFSVGGRSFSYSDFDLSRCGFNNTASHGGPISAGHGVRVTYHGSHILRLEVAER